MPEPMCKERAGPIYEYASNIVQVLVHPRNPDTLYSHQIALATLLVLNIRVRRAQLRGHARVLGDGYMHDRAPRLTRRRVKCTEVELHRLHARTRLDVLRRDTAANADEDQVKLDSGDLQVLSGSVSQGRARVEDGSRCQIRGIRRCCRRS